MGPRGKNFNYFFLFSEENPFGEKIHCDFLIFFKVRDSAKFLQLPLPLNLEVKVSK